MKRWCLAIDLKNDPELIARYEYWHEAENCWPEVKQSILQAGILNMEIYRTGNRLFMIMETTDNFDAARKAAIDASNETVVRWEALMDNFQQPLPWAKEGGKWTLMDKIYQL